MERKLLTMFFWIFWIFWNADDTDALQRGFWRIFLFSFWVWIVSALFGVKKATVVMSPNPAADSVTLSYRLTSTQSSVEIYDIAGRSISTNVLSSSVGDLQLNTSSYPSGIYIVVVKQDGVLLAQKKLIIE